jgi:hypothetical protein
LPGFFSQWNVSKKGSKILLIKFLSVKKE